MHFIVTLTPLRSQEIAATPAPVDVMLDLFVSLFQHDILSSILHSTKAAAYSSAGMNVDVIANEAGARV